VPLVHNFLKLSRPQRPRPAQTPGVSAHTHTHTQAQGLPSATHTKAHVSHKERERGREGERQRRTTETVPSSDFVSLSLSVCLLTRACVLTLYSRRAIAGLLFQSLSRASRAAFASHREKRANQTERPNCCASAARPSTATHRERERERVSVRTRDRGFRVSRHASHVDGARHTQNRPVQIT
jgi:hypothetical protein